MGGRERAKQEQQGVRGLRGQMQAPERFLPDFGLPEEQGAAGAGTQDLGIYAGTPENSVVPHCEH